MSGSLSEKLSGPCGYPDLGATVYPHHVPCGLAEELPALYSSVFSTLDWFLTQDRRVPTGVVVLEEPRHVLLFYQDGGTVEVLNKVFYMPAVDAVRACKALFRAFPRAHRIHLEALFPPDELELPRGVIAWTDHMVVDLPATVKEYRASLGKRTRENLSQWTNRLNRAVSDVTTEIAPCGDRTEELFDLFLSWKLARFEEKGMVSHWETEPGLAARTMELLCRCGEAHITRIDGKEAAIYLAVRTHDTVCPLAGSFDLAYEPFRLGFLALYAVICDAIERGAVRVNLMWGEPTRYKRNLGANPVRATQLSIFRLQPARLLTIEEPARIHYRRRTDYYWKARHVASRVVKATARRAGLADLFSSTVPPEGSS